jgi:hypothetical protein
MSAPSSPVPPPSPAPPSPPARWCPAGSGVCPPPPEICGEAEQPSSETAGERSATSEESGGCAGRVCKGVCGETRPMSHVRVFRKASNGSDFRSYERNICHGNSAKLIRELRKLVGPPPDKCELCGRVESLCLDHDHVTQEFRGWLCPSCNTSLGGLGDSVEGLRRAIAYLERPRSGASSSRASPY